MTRELTSNATSTVVLTQCVTGTCFLRDENANNCRSESRLLDVSGVSKFQSAMRTFCLLQQGVLVWISASEMTSCVSGAMLNSAQFYRVEVLTQASN